MAVAPESECVELMEMESSAYVYLDGITTVTFFDGAVALEQVKDRLVHVVQASPWLAWKLVKNKKSKNIQMSFDPSPTKELILGKLLEQIEVADISPTMPFETLIKKISKDTNAHIKDTGFGLLKKGLPYTKVTVVKNKGSSGNSWALVFSVSHVIADGYTYYKILSMLGSQAEAAIVSLNPRRHHNFVPQLKEAVGEKEYNTVMGAAPLMMNYFSTMTFGGKPRVRSFFVDLSKIEEAKEKSKSEKTSDFVSTNDILTAFWGRLTQARLVEMAVNFRGRFPELQFDDAGNYEGCILFSTGDVADPGNIRKALQRTDGKFQSTLEPPRNLPGSWEMCRCKYRIITNWASFFSELHFDGCTQRLHVPYMSPSTLPTDILVIFRPTKDTLGVFIVTRKLSDEQLTSRGPEGSFLGAQILPAPFKK
eukprot:TRINITY_DN8658_c0_g1_i1.p1 TRINITY_DN8658_c0_g1~~TRINITY_DN8658_c0_g1_i1.p1  ORF type:complete len:423 (+),score=82.30 TRINITY_DN8658_c0_g1_i1:90-1358(+)